jgi:hypothetical protein
VTWHEDAARDAFVLALTARGHDEVYREVEIGRATSWCDEPDCDHHVRRAVIGQTHTGDESIHQLWCRGHVEAFLASGRVRRTAIQVGVTPGADRDHARNQQKLTDALAGWGFEADVQPSTGGRTDDGDVTWAGDLGLLSPAEVDAGVPPAAVLGPGRASLEIGYTLPSRTYTHLYERGAVWRWPYGSDRLTLLAAVAEHDEGWWIKPLHLDVDWDLALSPPPDEPSEGRDTSPTEGCLTRPGPPTREKQP